MVYECVCEWVCVNVCVWTTFENVHFQTFLTCIRMCEVLVIYMNLCVSICVWEHPVGVYIWKSVNVCVSTSFKDVRFQVFLTEISMCEVLLTYMKVCVWKHVCEHPLGVYDCACVDVRVWMCLYEHPLRAFACSSQTYQCVGCFWYLWMCVCESVCVHTL